jgi:Tfp pilus assembly protein FimT
MVPPVPGPPRGVTLVELLSLVLVTGILGMVAIPQFSASLQSFRLNGAARKIVADLRLAQSHAVAQGGLYRFHSGNEPGVGHPEQYRLEQSTNGGSTWSGVTAWYRLASDFQGIRVLSVQDSAGSPVPVYEVQFNSQGACANCPGLTTPIVIAVSGPAGTRAIQVRSAGSVSTP